MAGLHHSHQSMRGPGLPLHVPEAQGTTPHCGRRSVRDLEWDSRTKNSVLFPHPCELLNRPGDRLGPSAAIGGYKNDFLRIPRSLSLDMPAFAQPPRSASPFNTRSQDHSMYPQAATDLPRRPTTIIAASPYLDRSTVIPPRLPSTDHGFRRSPVPDTTLRPAYSTQTQEFNEALSSLARASLFPQARADIVVEERTTERCVLSRSKTVTNFSTVPATSQDHKRRSNSLIARRGSSRIAALWRFRTPNSGMTTPLASPVTAEVESLRRLSPLPCVTVSDSTGIGEDDRWEERLALPHRYHRKSSGSIVAIPAPRMLFVMNPDQSESCDDEDGEGTASHGSLGVGQNGVLTPRLAHEPSRPGSPWDTRLPAPIRSVSGLPRLPSAHCATAAQEWLFSRVSTQVGEVPVGEVEPDVNEANYYPGHDYSQPGHHDSSGITIPYAPSRTEALYHSRQHVHREGGSEVDYLAHVGVHIAGSHANALCTLSHLLASVTDEHLSWVHRLQELKDRKEGLNYGVVAMPADCGQPDPQFPLQASALALSNTSTGTGVGGQSSMTSTSSSAIGPHPTVVPSLLGGSQNGGRQASATPLSSATSHLRPASLSTLSTTPTASASASHPSLSSLMDEHARVTNDSLTRIIDSAKGMLTANQQLRLFVNDGDSGESSNNHPESDAPVNPAATADRNGALLRGPGAGLDSKASNSTTSSTTSSSAPSILVIKPSFNQMPSALDQDAVLTVSLTNSATGDCKGTVPAPGDGIGRWSNPIMGPTCVAVLPEDSPPASLSEPLGRENTKDIPTTAADIELQPYTPSGGATRSTLDSLSWKSSSSGGGDGTSSLRSGSQGSRESGVSSSSCHSPDYSLAADTTRSSTRPGSRPVSVFIEESSPHWAAKSTLRLSLTVSPPESLPPLGDEERDRGPFPCGGGYGHAKSRDSLGRGIDRLWRKMVGQSRAAAGPQRNLLTPPPTPPGHAGEFPITPEKAAETAGHKRPGMRWKLLRRSTSRRARDA